MPIPLMVGVGILALALSVGGLKLAEQLGTRGDSDASGTKTAESSDAEEIPEAGPPAPDTEPPDPEVTARSLCERRVAHHKGVDNQFNAMLLASYPTTAAVVAEEEERRKGDGFRSPFRDRPPEEIVAHCFFEADSFGRPYRPSSGDLPAGAHQRLEEVVSADGTPYVLDTGRKEAIHPAPISSSED